MKTPGLSPRALVATLFLIVSLHVSGAQGNAPPPAPAEGTEAGAGLEEERASLGRVLRAAVAADPVQLRRFDRNQDGKIDDAEWAQARPAIMGALAAPVGVLHPTSAEEKRRLDNIAAEVARRRALREAANSTGTTPPLNDAQREVEAKMLVKDLLEIGMAQRRAFDEAAKKPGGALPQADIEKKASAEPAAKKQDTFLFRCVRAVR